MFGTLCHLGLDSQRLSSIFAPAFTDSILPIFPTPPMSRRAQSGVRPAQWLVLIVILVVVGGGGFALMNRTTNSMNGVTDLSAGEFMENATSLSGNEYKVEGIIDDRLDNWRSTEGRLFSLQISDGSGNTFVPVWVPPDYKGANIQRGQRYILKVFVMETGVLKVLNLIKA